jgi:CubicO group peptidase (beta-lactamase class C family)
MSSGLEKFADTFSPFTRALRSELGSDVLDVTLALKSISKPGESFYYTGRNVDLLVHVLERASGMRYTDILSQKLLKPASAGSAWVWLDRPAGHAQAGRSLYIRLPDLYQLAKSFVDPEQRLVPEGWIDFMKSPSLANPHFGAGVWLGLSASPERPNVQSAVQQSVDLHADGYDDISFLAGFGGQRVYLMQQMRTVVIFVGQAQSDWDESVIPGAVTSALVTCSMAQHSG